MKGLCRSTKLAPDLNDCLYCRRVTVIEQLPAPLLRDLVEGRWLPLLGAGMSRNAQVGAGEAPADWRGLGKALGRQVRGHEGTDGALESLSAFEHRFGRQALLWEIQSLTRASDALPGAAHHAFAALGFDTVVTTNFDSLLEGAYADIRRPVQVVAEESLLASHRGPNMTRLVKMHGDFTHLGSLVVTEADYEGFLSRYPLMATTVGALLVSHTGVLFGYSLDDPDTRQVLRVITDRLGRLARPIWTIQIDPTPSEIERFERRGVKVVNLHLPPGQTTDGLLAQLFRELGDHWSEHVLRRSISSDDALGAELLLPEQKRRICFFAVPTLRVGWYRQNVFPLVREQGLIPASSSDLAAPEGAGLAALASVARRSIALIYEVATPNAQYEASLFAGAVDQRKRLRIARSGEDLPSDVAFEAVLLTEGEDESSEDEDALGRIRDWLRRITDSETPRHAGLEAQQLLDNGHYGPAIVSAVADLENALRKLAAGDESEGQARNSRTLTSLLGTAREDGIIDEDALSRTQEAVHYRNRIIHLRDDRVTPELASALVASVRDVIKAVPARTTITELEQVTDGSRTEPPKWTPSLAALLLERLEDRSPSQAAVLQAAVNAGGAIDRSSAYRLAGLPEDRTLRGFVKPMKSAANVIAREHGLDDWPSAPMKAVYDPAFSYVMLSGYEVDADLLDALRQDPHGDVAARGVEAPG